MEELLQGLSSEPMTDEEFERSLQFVNDEISIDSVDFAKELKTKFDF